MKNFFLLIFITFIISNLNAMDRVIKHHPKEVIDTVKGKAYGLASTDMYTRKPAHLSSDFSLIRLYTGMELPNPFKPEAVYICTQGEGKIHIGESEFFVTTDNALKIEKDRPRKVSCGSKGIEILIASNRLTNESSESEFSRLSREEGLPKKREKNDLDILASSEHFRVKKFTLSAGQTYLPSVAHQLLCVLTGTCSISLNNGKEKETLGRYDSVALLGGDRLTAFGKKVTGILIEDASEY